AKPMAKTRSTWALVSRVKPHATPARTAVPARHQLHGRAKSASTAATRATPTETDSDSLNTVESHMLSGGDNATTTRPPRAITQAARLVNNRATCTARSTHASTAHTVARTTNHRLLWSTAFKRSGITGGLSP